MTLESCTIEKFLSAVSNILLSLFSLVSDTQPGLPGFEERLGLQGGSLYSLNCGVAGQVVRLPDAVSPLDVYHLLGFLIQSVDEVEAVPNLLLR